MKKHWPMTDEERRSFADWQTEVAENNTALGFREWLANANHEGSGALYVGPDEIVGKTITDVRITKMAGRDTCKDWVTWDQHTLTFSDGTTATFGGIVEEVYDVFEYDHIDDNGDPVAGEKAL